ncbi:polyprenyl synthetase family protein [Rhodophyticola sp. SM2404]
MFQTALTDAQAQIGEFLEQSLTNLGDNTIADGMRYATTGGKRLRGFLVIETARLFDVPASQSLFAAAAVECLHAYSLVHDDLPCMDDDDLRRGQPTVHKKWDEATAVLVGDALQGFAFELLSRRGAGDPTQRIELVQTLAKACGAEGMVLGQAQDIAAETAGRALTLDEIRDLQRNKTGQLIEWPARAGAILGRADPLPLLQYANAIGLAFQIADDILDVEGDAETAGKALRKDADAGKATFVSLMGLAGAKAEAQALVEQAETALSSYGEKAQTLKALARYIIARDK